MDRNEALTLAWVRTATRSGLARDIRRAGQLSQVETAAAIGVARSTVSLWEEGRRAPHGSAALRYASLLKKLQRMATNG